MYVKDIDVTFATSDNVVSVAAGEVADSVPSHYKVDVSSSVSVCRVSQGDAHRAFFMHHPHVAHVYQNDHDVEVGQTSR